MGIDNEPRQLSRNHLLLLVLFFVGLAGCEPSKPRQEVDDVAYTAETRKWHEKRIASLTSQDGWLNLAGLFWLKEGENTFGAHESNDLVFPASQAPDFMGSFVLKDGIVSVKIKSLVEVMHSGQPVTSMTLRSSADGEPTVLTYGSLGWFIVQRGNDSMAVRVRDSEHPHLKEFKGIDTYPVDPAWRIKASFEPYDPPKMLTIPTVYGTILQQPSPGALVFEIDGNPYRLDPTSSSDDKRLFVMFADETSQSETYGAGRFLYVSQPGPDGTTYIDFNKAYNPPCAFTNFATCPLPPTQNRLPLRITAGEKKYKHAH